MPVVPSLRPLTLVIVISLNGCDFAGDVAPGVVLLLDLLVLVLAVAEPTSFVDDGPRGFEFGVNGAPL